MGEILEFVFICILIYYVFKMLFRMFAPTIFENVVNKAQQNYQQQQQQQQYRASENQQQYYTRATPGNGKIKVDYVPPKTKKKGSIPDSEGDFVDFEEVK